jgi:hypothetical protein
MSPRFGRAASLVLLLAVSAGCDDDGVVRGGDGGDASAAMPDVIPDQSPEATADATADAVTDAALDVAVDSAADAADTAAQAGDAAAPDGARAFLRLIDDFESGATAGVGREVKLPYAWFACANLLGLFCADGGRMPESGIKQVAGPDAFERAFHLTGGPFEDGGDLFIDFHRPPLADHADLSAYAGIAFWARSGGADHTIIVAVEDGPVVDPRKEIWESALNSDDWWPVRTISVSQRWQRFVLLFDDFHRGVPDSSAFGPPLDTRVVNAIHFIDGTGAGPIDLWIDDLALLCRGACPP